VKLALKKKSEATKCSNRRTVGLIALAAKLVARMLRRRIEKKIEDVLGEHQFGFRRGRGTRHTAVMKRISEQALDIDEEVCRYFIEHQQTFDPVYWTTLMHILRETGIDLRERRLIGKLYMNQCITVLLMGRGVKHGCC